MFTIGDRLLEAFWETHQTRDKEKIAQMLGYKSEQSVYKILRGEREMGFEALKNFTFYTKRSINWLLTGEQAENTQSRENPNKKETNENEQLTDEELEDIEWNSEHVTPTQKFFVSTFEDTVVSIIRDTVPSIIENYLALDRGEKLHRNSKVYTNATLLQDLGDIDEFNVEESVEKYDTLEETLEAWYLHEGKEMPEGFGLNFGGWEKLSLEDKIQTVKDVKAFADKMNELIDKGELEDE